MIVASLKPPGERRIYRVADSLFRVWIDRPDASAEIRRGDEWIFTPIPSGSIMAHPRAEQLTPADVEVLNLND